MPTKQIEKIAKIPTEELFGENEFSSLQNQGSTCLANHINDNESYQHSLFVSIKFKAQELIGEAYTYEDIQNMLINELCYKWGLTWFLTMTCPLENNFYREMAFISIEGADLLTISKHIILNDPNVNSMLRAIYENRQVA